MGDKKDYQNVHKKRGLDESGSLPTNIHCGLLKQIFTRITIPLKGEKSSPIGGNFEGLEWEYST